MQISPSVYTTVHDDDPNSKNVNNTNHYKNLTRERDKTQDSCHLTVIPATY